MAAERDSESHMLTTSIMIIPVRRRVSAGKQSLKQAQ